MKKSLQEQFFAKGICFGCGPANEKGLRIKSYEEGEHLVAHWTPQDHHQAYPGMLCGGIVGSLLDCHCNWTAAWHLMKKNGTKSPPCTVTAHYSIKLHKPTPINQELKLISTVETSSDDRATISARLEAGDKICATCEGLFVAVKEGHPAYHRW